MLVSSNLRKTNIAEYLLYMWQVEDLLRTAGLDSSRLESLVDASGCTAEQHKEWMQWYDDLIDMMKREGVTEKGHLQINRNIVILLADLHSRLLDCRKDFTEQYRETYYKVLPDIVAFRSKSAGTDKNEIENCFEFMYGVWLLRLKGQQLTDATAGAAARVSAFLAQLASFYSKDSDGELDFDKED